MRGPFATAALTAIPTGRLTPPALKLSLLVVGVEAPLYSRSDATRLLVTTKSQNVRWKTLKERMPLTVSATVGYAVAGREAAEKVGSSKELISASLALKSN